MEPLGCEQIFWPKRKKRLLGLFLVNLAEEVRFELTEDFHPRQFSRLVHSTALPLFHLLESDSIQAPDYKELLI
jgi:hypothetical protein